MLLRIGRGVAASAPLAKAVRAWLQPHAPWVIGRASTKLRWAELLAAVDAAQPGADRRPQALLLADELARLLALAPFDAALLSLMVASDRLPRVAALTRLAVEHGHDLPMLLGEIAGAAPNDAEAAVRRSPVLRLRLVRFVANRQGRIETEVDWMLTRLLDRASTDPEDVLDTLAGYRQPPTLGLDDFAHVADAEFLVRLLRGAATEGAEGINILIHGPPGTGKTELARALAAATGLALHAVGEADEDGDEPNRFERLTALRVAQRLLAGRGNAALLFDEMEDLIGDARPSAGDWFAHREGSKVFVNRLLEANPVPVIWTTNAIGNIDNAIVRRMSFVLKLDLPSRRTGLRMLERVAADERVTPGARFDGLLDVAPEAATVLRVSARAARLAGEADGGVRSAEALVRALRGRELPIGLADSIDLDLFESDVPLAPLFARMAALDEPDFTLLLTGPPGTGKTAAAHHLARALDRPLLIKRASDLLSKWVGETEAQIAGAFAEARQQGSVLLFDEADSLLFDRTTARASWEVGQVNEMLTWLDRHPLPVIAATNHPGSLDPATLRRFVFKLRLRPLGRAAAARAFERFFAVGAPASLGDLRNLTPGDFAVVSRQLRYAPVSDAEELVERLALEAAAKPETGVPIGF
ncbi:ATP-binding protein [Sphingomonas jatrophae]|nr:ATP-binding protein [Sphingomonas jatrophae]